MKAPMTTPKLHEEDPNSSTVDFFFNPFPGLRPFRIEESFLFFGREGQTEEVLHKLAEQRFVAVVGPSGSGKSSFIYCGVIPVLHGGFMPNTPFSAWNIIVTRPGGGPIKNLCEALLENDDEYRALSKEDKHIQRIIVNSMLRSSSRGLVEVIRKNPAFKNRNTLILVDQFEELFRFRKSEIEAHDVQNESLAFVNLLMESIQAADLPIYVAITMRSDFVGDCAHYTELTEAINRSYYMIPQMTRNQKQLAITGPIKVAGGQIAPRLVTQLLNDLGDSPDQLPILQHALMRTWSYWQRHRKPDEPLDIAHYEAIGTMSEALSLHANEAYDELAEPQKIICERLFKTITEKNSEGFGTFATRLPTSVADISKITAVDIEALLPIIEVFRRTGRSLLMPPPDQHLTPDTVIDLSHESLMRIWGRLKTWIDEENESIEMYKRLSDAAEAFQIGMAGLWRPPDLQLALAWRDKNQPSVAWAERYAPGFEQAMVFLNQSRDEYEEEQRIKDEAQQQALRRARVTALFLGTATVVSIGFLVFALVQMVNSQRSAVEAKGFAEKAKKGEIEANELRLKAERSAREAQLLSIKAENSAIIANTQRLKATQKAEEAEQQRKLAEASANEALLQKETAELERKKADRERQRAEQQRQKAEENAQKAIEATDEAYRLRLLSIAQSMAVKSLQMTDNRVKALNAQQAYSFNSNNGGMKYHPDIFDGLYYAIKQLNDGSYNNLSGHTDAVRSIETGYDNRYLYSAGSDGKILRWDSQNFNTPTVMAVNNYVNRALAISSDNQWVAVGGDADRIQLFSTQSPTVVNREIKNFSGSVWSMKFSANSKSLLIATSTNKLYFWDFQQMRELKQLSERINSIAISPNGAVAYISTETGKIYTINTEKTNPELVEFYQNNAELHAISISPNGRYLVAGDINGFVRIWDMSTQKLQIKLEGHRARINNIEFSRDGNRLATASFDKTVRLWNMQKLNDQPIVLRDHNDWVWSIAFNADGSRLLAGCKDNLVRVWPTNPDLMNDQLCSKLTHNFSNNEWQRYVADDIPYELTCPDKPPHQGDEY